MPNAIETLLDFVGKSGTGLADYVALEKKNEEQEPLPTLQDELQLFLRSTMDQVRVNKALDCTHRILKIADLEDFEMFREGVWKREATRGMDYQKQRDHTAHTLNNWLLGWFFYAHSQGIKTAINGAIEKREWDSEAPEKFSYEQFFGHAWQYTSLLHDIGYLFEGSITNMETGNQSAQAEIGLKTADEYFNMAFWIETGETSTHSQKKLRELIEMPELPREASLSRIAIYLRSLGSLDNLSSRVSEELRVTARGQRQRKKPKELRLPSDAFDLWRAHFNEFGQEDAAHRITKLEKAFLQYVTKGMPGFDIRVLDHGVCSGLLQLKIATFFYNLFANFDKLNDDNSEYSAKSTATRLEVREGDVAVRYDYEYWWKGLIWASASAALHNIQQRKGAWSPGVVGGKLSLQEEPLTYLGILVDCIQDWDRYFVYDSRTRSPVQGIDVGLSCDDGKIILTVSKDLGEKIVGDLDVALEAWRDFVDIKFLTKTATV
ncbi:hypothetical protein [Paraburkholderia bryophila]|uniref:Uncharacterized protein n=1 Tax=Paraburkholderia bryophila TaxID=420952 RepID=A0A7Y9WPE1_9BURK|nr:hypothetical protein [Paraburkholderia bryophila]NYH24227.1 hypothetical protein [Paraburkholderia bryophila]